MDSWQQGQSSPFLGWLRKPSSSILHPDPSPAKKKEQKTADQLRTLLKPLHPGPKRKTRKTPRIFFRRKMSLPRKHGSRKATARDRGTKLVWNSVISTFKAPSKRKDAVKDEMIWAMRPRGSGSPPEGTHNNNKSRCPWILPTGCFFWKCFFEKKCVFGNSPRCFLRCGAAVFFAGMVCSCRSLLIYKMY